MAGPLVLPEPVPPKMQTPVIASLNRKASLPQLRMMVSGWKAGWFWDANFMSFEGQSGGHEISERGKRTATDNPLAGQQRTNSAAAKIVPATARTTSRWHPCQCQANG